MQIYTTNNNSNNQSPCVAADRRRRSFRDEFRSNVSSLLLRDCMKESNQCPSYGPRRRGSSASRPSRSRSQWFRRESENVEHDDFVKHTERFTDLDLQF
jgi:hypothetical protein